MSTEAPTFAKLVDNDQLDKARQKREDAGRILATAQEAYDANLAEIERLGIKTQFEGAAQSIKEITGREASVIVSIRPRLENDDLRPKIPFVKGSAECEVTLEWKPSGTFGVKNSILVWVANGELVIRSGKPGNLKNWCDERFKLENIDLDALKRSLFEAYQHPYQR